MKVLIVSSATNGKTASFIQEQIESLNALGIDIHQFTINQKGVSGYLNTFPKLRKVLRKLKPDLIHAHYGLCGLLCNLQRRIPVVTTYHGSDINVPKSRRFSKWSVRFSASNIYVTSHLRVQVADTRGNEVPCGVDTSLFVPKEKNVSQIALNWDTSKKYALFSSSFDNAIKNSPLALAAVENYNAKHREQVTLMELKDMTREQVVLAINACEFVLLTSYSEGSPQIIKEALACNRPIVSTNVGSVEEMVSHLEGCYVVDSTIKGTISGICEAMKYSANNHSTNGRERIKEQGLSLDKTADRLKSIYNSVLTTKSKQS